MKNKKHNKLPTISNRNEILMSWWRNQTFQITPKVTPNPKKIQPTIIWIIHNYVGSCSFEQSNTIFWYAQSAEPDTSISRDKSPISHQESPLSIRHKIQFLITYTNLRHHPIKGASHKFP